MSRNGSRSCAVALALLTLLLASGCALPGLDDIRDGVIHPTIEPVRDVSGTRLVEKQFAFEDSVVTLRVPVDSAVYAGAVKADKRAIFLRGEQPPDWVADYYRAFIDEEQQEAFYASLIEALHEVRDERGLDASRYVELVTSMAQGLEYRIDPGDLAPKFPIETFADGYGDCDDKTLLSAAILSREGYDVAVFFFGPEEHVAMGVAAPQLDYKGTRYAYVEMTKPSLVGVPPHSLEGGTKLESRPEVVGIGQGRAAYAAGVQIELITERLGDVRREIAVLADRIKTDMADLDEQRARVEEEKRVLQSSDVVTEEQVLKLNAKVDAYNALVVKSNSVVSRHNELAEAERFAIEHPENRPEVYRRLRALRL